MRDFSKRNCERAQAENNRDWGIWGGFQLPFAVNSNSPSDFGNEEGECRNHAKSERTRREQERLKRTEKEIQGDLSFERVLQSGAETQGKERKQPQQQNRGLDER